MTNKKARGKRVHMRQEVVGLRGGGVSGDGRRFHLAFADKIRGLPERYLVVRRPVEVHMRRSLYCLQLRPAAQSQSNPIPGQNEKRKFPS